MNYPAEQNFHDENSIQPQQGDQNIPQQQIYDPRQPMSLPSGMNNRAMNAKQAYAQELQEQMRQKQEQKYRELEQDRNVGVYALRARLDNDPFGRQGAGAPIRDIFGNIDTTKNKALKYMYQHTQPPVVQQNPNNFGMTPAFSLKARLARENIVSQSVDGLPRGFSQPMLGFGGGGGNPPQGYPPLQAQPQYPQYPPAEPLNYSQPELNYPPMQQQPYQMPEINYMGNMGNTYMPSPNPVTSRKTHNVNNASLPYPQPIGQAEDHEAKQKRIATHVELQNDLLRQMEEKKMRKAAEEARKKMEDEVEELRVRRENEEMLLKDQSEVDKKKRMYQNFQQENQKLINEKGDINNNDFVVLEPKKNETKVSVPVEQQPSAKFAHVHQLIKEQEQIPPQNSNSLNLEHVPIEDFPTQVGRHLQGSIVGQIDHLRRDWESQQNMLHDQLLDLKHQLHLANRERALTQDQIGELKSHLRDQQIGEEIRRTQLYNALLMGQNILQQKPVYSTITRFPEERETDGGAFEFPKSRGRHMYKMNDEEDALDAMLAGQSKIISSPNIQFGNHGRFVEKATSRPMSSHSALDGGTSMGLNYLNYYNSSEDHTDDWEKSGNSNFNFDESGARGEFADIYRKNRERLDRLEDLEKRELIGEHPYARESAKGLTGIDDEIYQMLKSDY